MKYKYNDGGRSKYFKADAKDCVTRAICIATGFDYKEVYNNIKNLINHTPRNGLSKQETRDIMEYYGFTWHPTMEIGQGCKMHLCENEIPKYDIVVYQVSHHLTTTIGGVINDTFNPSRDGKRCVYGYWTIEEE